MILAGKDVDTQSVSAHFKDHDCALVQCATVSRGVRRLERDDAELVLLAPDAGDTTWPRTISRIREEYQRRVIVLLQDEGGEAQALESGAFDCFSFGDDVTGCLASSLRHLQSQMVLEQQLSRERATLEWMEISDAFGSWEMGADGKVHWSQGLLRILEKEGCSLDSGFSGLRQCVYQDDLEIFDRANEATFERGWPLDFEYRVRGDGKVRHLHVKREVELDSGGKVIRAYGMARDVSLQKEFEELLFRRDAILQVLANFVSRFLRTADWDKGIADALDNMGKVVDVSRIFLFRKDGQRASEETLSMVHEWVGEGVAPLKNRPELQGRDFFLQYDSWRAAMLRQKIVAGHVRHFRKVERAFFDSTGAKSVMIVPVFAGNIWWGLLGLSEHRQERDWLPVEIESMTLAANLFGSAIHYGLMSDKLIAANRSAEEASSLALEANMAKSMFLANMSHEIRTPISGVLGMAEMMITTGLTSEQREHMDMIRDAAKSLLHIVNDILDISKIEAGKMELKPEDFTFRSSLATSVRSFGPQAELNNLVFQYRVADDVPARLNGDPDRLGQVLWNLIGNALKFTERGLVELTVEVSKREKDRICLLFKVRDTGVGIPEEKLGAVFDSFTQADSSLRKKHQGTGLGLTISRQLVNMMGGEIGLESTVGQGSTFFFTAWFRAVENQEAVAEDVLKPQAPETLHLNILLADDNPMNRKYLKHFLTMFGHTIVTAENGLEVLSILEARGREIDLVLMDVQMPEMSGIEATRAIRESDGRLYDRSLPVIALTAYAMMGDRERMLDSGMDDYVSKPVDMHKLSEAIVRSMAGRSKASRGAVRKAAAAPPLPRQAIPESKPVKLDMEALTQRFSGNMELFKDILDLFLLEARQKLDDLDNGLAAGDLKSVGEALHSITNISSHVLAMEVVRLSRVLEKKCYSGEMEVVVAGVKKLRPRFIALVGAVEVAANEL
nr:response regulator [Pseudodesulfovibrio sp. S3-i]